MIGSHRIIRRAPLLISLAIATASATAAFAADDRAGALRVPPRKAAQQGRSAVGQWGQTIAGHVPPGDWPNFGTGAVRRTVRWLRALAGCHGRRNKAQHRT